jgi:hypothetical protein
MMEDTQLQELADDIRRNGQHVDIEVDEHGRIIDGRNRSAACEIAQVEPRTRTVTGLSFEQVKERCWSLRLTETRSEFPWQITVIANTNVAKDGRVDVVTEHSYRTIAQYALHAACVRRPETPMALVARNGGVPNVKRRGEVPLSQDLAILSGRVTVFVV